MRRTRRALLAALAVIGIAQLADVAPAAAEGPWACVVVEQIDRSACVWNPLPEELPERVCPRTDFLIVKCLPPE